MDTATFTRERPSSTSSTRPSNDANGPSFTRTALAHFVMYGRLRTLDALLHLPLDARRLGFGNRHRLVVGAKEARHLRRVLEEVIDIVGQIALHEHIAWEELAFGRHLATAAHLDDIFSRHEDFLELMRKPALRRLLADGFRNFFSKFE